MYTFFYLFYSYYNTYFFYWYCHECLLAVVTSFGIKIMITISISIIV